MKTTAPQRRCLVISRPDDTLSSVQRDAEVLQKAALESGVFDQVLCSDATVSDIRSQITVALETLPSESLLLVYYAGHGFRAPGVTLVVPEDAEDWSESLSLEHELASQVASFKRTRSYLTVCCIYGTCRSWKTSILSKGGLLRPPEQPRIECCETDAFLTIFLDPVHPQHTTRRDYSMVGAAAHLLCSHTDSLQSYFLMLKDEIRYISLGHLEPELFNGDILNIRSVSMHRGSAMPTFQPIMVDSVLDSFVHAPLLREHMFGLMRNELNEGYCETRKAIVQVVEAASHSLGDLSWMASMQVQLQSLRQSRLVDVARMLEDWAKAAYRLPSKPQAALHTVPCQSLECIIAALQDERGMQADTTEIPSCISKLLGLLDKTPFRREILARDLLGDGPGLDWEYVRIPGQEPDALSAEEKSAFTQRVQDLLSLLASTKVQPASRILLARGSIWLMIGSRLSDSDMRLFERNLQEYILDRKAKSSGWTFARPPQFRPFAMVPLGTSNLVMLAGAFLAKTAPSHEACWLHVAGFKELVRNWIDQVGFNDGTQSSDWRVQLLRLGRPLDDDEWLQSTSNLRIVAEPTWTTLRGDASLEGLLQVLQELSKREVDGVQWVTTQSFEHLVSTSLSLVFTAKFLHEPLCEILQGERARECREPRSLHELLWKELLRRCATFPFEEDEPAPPVGAGYAEPSPQPSTSTQPSHSAGPVWDEVTTLVLEQLSRFAASRECFLKLLEVKGFFHAEAYPELVEVVRGLSQPVATRGSPSNEIDDEIDQELSQTLSKLSDDIGTVGVEQAICRFIEEWN
ncbi:unnamed protein product [Symbiodinium sp. CCMP2456]|nr:unnamed protein product [Symbiodinium sp. CCMP2456]